MARLTLAGRRAVDRLAAVVDADPSPRARVAALRALEAIGEPGALRSILGAAGSADPDVATAAMSAAAPFLSGPHGPLVIDRLTALALDSTRPDTVRIAAVQPLRILKDATLAPLLERLAHDSSEALRLEPQRPRQVDPAAMLASAANGNLPADPDELAALIHQAERQASLATLVGLVERIRAREIDSDKADPADLDAGRRAAWTRARGRAHLALARRGSRLALYDLRESLNEARDALPVEFLAALVAIGDRSCLDAIAAACARTTADEWWRRQLVGAFRTIVAREKLTRRHAVVKKVEERHKDVLELLWTGRHRPAAASTPWRTTPR